MYYMHYLSVVDADIFYKVLNMGDGVIHMCIWHVIPVGTFICGTWSLYYAFSTIFTGGVGKNGSTVAVSFYKTTSACNAGLNH